MNNIRYTPTYAGPTQSPRLDQVNVEIPRSLAGARGVGIMVGVDNGASSAASNWSTIYLK